ncbi:MAG: nucleotidyltransferase family protein [Akkermansiaceae bacterium]|nr:nucleotidyltransferase family protein [Akkermansiaceae bacterium]
MPSPEPFRIFTRKLEELGLRYMVSGSVAAIYYGEPRLTNDVDLIVLVTEADVPRIEEAFPAEDFYCPPREVIALEVSREQRGHFNLIHHETGFKADIYLVGRDELHLWALSRAEAVDLDRDLVRFAPPDYVMIRKLQFFKEGGSEKHLRDIRRMIESLGPDWPRETLTKLISKYGLEAEWDRAQEA